MKIMRWIVLLVIAIFFSSCESTPEPKPTLPDVSFDVYRDGYFQVVVPDWPANPKGDVETIFSVQNDGQFISINRYQHIPELFWTTGIGRDSQRSLGSFPGRIHSIPGKYSLGRVIYADQ